jgi:hypothetical protein
MNNYDKYKAIDFVNDPVFRAWVFNKDFNSEHELAHWMVHNPSAHHEVQKAKLYLLNIQDSLPEVSETYIEDKIHDFWKTVAHRNVQTQEENPKVAFYFYKIFAIAASIFLIIGFFLSFNKQEQPISSLLSGLFEETSLSNRIEKSNKTKIQEKVILPDGSTIILEPNSSIVYSKVFDEDIREVNLIGEAFFDVVRNPEKPFIVHFNELVVKVLGTSFTIKANKNDNNMQVLVKTGKVSVFEKEDWQKIKNTANATIHGVIITANQKLKYSKETAKFEKMLIENPEIIDLIIKDDDFVFEETPLIEVFHKLEQAYGIKIVVDEHQIANCTITAELSDEPLSEKLNLICKIIHAKYEMIEGHIVMNVQSCSK